MDDNAKIWDEKWKNLSDYSLKSGGNRWAFFLIEKLLKHANIDNNCILDIGCGIGNKTLILANHFPNCKVLGIDFSKEAIHFAQNYYPNNNIHFECCDATFLDKNESQYSLVSLFEVIEHIQNWEAFLETICKVSNKYVLISTPTGKMRSYEKKLGHYRNFQKGQIENHMKTLGYKPIKVFYAGFPFWSPLTRDLFERMDKSNSKSQDETLKTINPLVHSIIYFLYRYLSFRNIGDQFIGLFEKIK